MQNEETDDQARITSATPESVPAGSDSRPLTGSPALAERIQAAAFEAVEALDGLDYHEGKKRKWEIVERAIRSVIETPRNESS